MYAVSDYIALKACAASYDVDQHQVDNFNDALSPTAHSTLFGTPPFIQLYEGTAHSSAIHEVNRILATFCKKRSKVHARAAGIENLDGWMYQVDTGL